MFDVTCMYSLTIPLTISHLAYEPCAIRMPVGSSYFDSCEYGMIAVEKFTYKKRP